MISDTDIGNSQNIDAFELANIIACGKDAMAVIERCRYDKTRFVASIITGYLVGYVNHEDREETLEKIVSIAKTGLENSEKRHGDE